MPRKSAAKWGAPSATSATMVPARLLNLSKAEGVSVAAVNGGIVEGLVGIAQALQFG